MTKDRLIVATNNTFVRLLTSASMSPNYKNAKKIVRKNGQKTRPIMTGLPLLTEVKESSTHT